MKTSIFAIDSHTVIRIARPDPPDEAPERLLAALLRSQARACEQIGSQLYSGLLDRAAIDVEAHGPTWVVLRGHEHDPRSSALALRLMGAVNHLVLRGQEPALAAAYEEGDGSAAWPPFRLVLEENVKRLRELVERPVQTNEVGRGAALLPGFLIIARETGMPLRLLEVGASAGLNLHWDRYRYQADGFTWGPVDSPLTIDFDLRGRLRTRLDGEVEVLDRRGCDLAPIDPTDPDGRLSLLAYVWPDQRVRITRLRAALDIAAGLPVSIDTEGAAAWVKRVLSDRSPGQATVLYHSIVMQYLSESEQVAFRQHVSAAGKEATDDAPLIWLRMEPAGKWADVRLTTWPGGFERHLARAGYHGSPVDLVAAAHEFDAGSAGAARRTIQ